MVTMIGDISGTVKIDSIYKGTEFFSFINVTLGPDPVIKYIGDINGITNIEISGKIDDDDISFLSSLEVAKRNLDKDIITGSVGIYKEAITHFINVDMFYKKLDITDSILDGNFTYEKDYLKNIGFNSSMKVVRLIEDSIYGTTSINIEDYTKSITSTMNIEGIAYLKDMIEGNATIEKIPFNSKLLDSAFVYAKENMDQNILEGMVTVNYWKSWFDINCRIHVPSHRILYTFLSKLRAVLPCDFDIDSKLDVFNDQIYDIPGDVMLIQDVYDDLVLDGNVDLLPSKYTDLDSNVTLEKVDTRREFHGYMYVVTPVNTDIDFSMDVETIYTGIDEDVLSKINVGNNLDQDILSQVLVQAALQSRNEIPSRLNVTNELLPSRIGIFVDPIWSYEPFVLKNAVSTFFDRIMNKHDVTVVFGGSPRANWDIRHFADVYRIPRYKQIEVLFDYVPTNPLLNRDSMYRYISALFNFRPRERRYIDRVFVFSNNTYAHNSTYLAPLYKACADHRIQLVVITSKGEFIGTDPSNLSRFINRNPIDPTVPMDRQPHWVHGAGTKHRDIFDDHPIV